MITHSITYLALELRVIIQTVTVKNFQVNLLLLTNAQCIQIMKT